MKLSNTKALAVGLLAWGSALAGCGGGGDSEWRPAPTHQDSGTNTDADAGLAVDAPPVEQDADASTTPESGEEAAPDAEQEAALDSPSDADAQGGECSPGAKDCQSSVPRLCDTAGSWVVQAGCTGASPVCLGGDCVNCAPGTSTCADGTTVEDCDSSGHWQTTTCPYVCLSGACTGSCVPGAVECQGNVPRACDGSGQWQSGAQCPFVCLNGSCSGVCPPGSKQCSGNKVQLCTASGQWQVDQACTYVCSSGACAGSCTPGTTQCSGGTVQTCQPNGTWQNGQNCPFVCSNGICSGSCVPGTKQCVGTELQTCDGAGAWQTSQTCPFICSNAACTGSCVPGMKQCSGLTAQTCSASGQWQTTETCPFFCSNGACSGSCVTGAKQCSGNAVQTCDIGGTWQTGAACQNSACVGGACEGTCVPGSSDCAGGFPMACSAKGVWIQGAECQNSACANGLCIGVCSPGMKHCSGTTVQTCNAQGQWGQDAPCPNPVNATPTCSGAGVCGYACNTGASDCDGDTTNGCEALLASDALNCGSCSRSCYGAACSAGVCQPQVVAANQENPMHLVLDPTHVYWGTLGHNLGNGYWTGQVNKASIATNINQTLTSGSYYLAVAVNSTKAFSTSGTNVVGSVFLNGTWYEPLLIKEAAWSTTRSLAATDAEIYFSDAGKKFIDKFTFSNSATTRLWTGVDSPLDMQLVGDTLYWRTLVNIYKMPTGGGPATVIATATDYDQIVSMGVDGQFAYWVLNTPAANPPYACTLTVKRTDTTTLESVDLYQTATTVYCNVGPNVAVDANHVYWVTDTVGLPQIVRIPKMGGSPSGIASGTQATDDLWIRVNNTFLYWLDSTAVMRMVKP